MNDDSKSRKKGREGYSHEMPENTLAQHHQAGLITTLIYGLNLLTPHVIFDLVSLTSGH